MNTCKFPYFLKFPLLFKVHPGFWDTVMCCHSNIWGALSLRIHRTRQQWGNYQEKINPFETLFKPLYYRTRLFQPRGRKKREISMHLTCELERNFLDVAHNVQLINRSRGMGHTASRKGRFWDHLGCFNGSPHIVHNTQMKSPHTRKRQPHFLQKQEQADHILAHMGPRTWNFCCWSEFCLFVCLPSFFNSWVIQIVRRFFYSFIKFTELDGQLLKHLEEGLFLSACFPYCF